MQCSNGLWTCWCVYPDAENMYYCSFPESFEPKNKKDLTKGCERGTSLPPCTGSGNEHYNSTSFMALNFTATIFLFNGWIFNSTYGHANECKRACSFDCSCHAVFYQVSTSSCHFMTNEISLLAMISNTHVRIWNYTANASDFDYDYDYDSDEVPFHDQEIYANDYVTYLKVANSSPQLPNVSLQPFSMMVLIGLIPFGIVVFLLLGLGAYYLRKRQRQLAQEAKEEEELCDILPLLPARFSYKELHEATKGFSQLLGAGGCGSVYAGTFPDGRRVAVKVLDGVMQGARQSKQFLAEIATIGRTNHHNIVRLVGFCWQVSHRLLVYEYVERGSLDRWLIGPGDMLLNWQKLFDIVRGVARGLHYLHEECEQSILHFDIKPQNILLNDAFEVKLADFGMSRLMNREMTSVMTGVRGTPGYIAPEWSHHGTVSKKSDVYSMGVVMLEIVAGRKVLDFSLLKASKSPADMESSAEEEEWHLPSWAAKKWVQGQSSTSGSARAALMRCRCKGSSTLLSGAFMKILQ